MSETDLAAKFATVEAHASDLRRTHAVRTADAQRLEVLAAHLGQSQMAELFRTSFGLLDFLTSTEADTMRERIAQRVEVVVATDFNRNRLVLFGELGQCGLAHVFNARAAGDELSGKFVAKSR